MCFYRQQRTLLGHVTFILHSFFELIVGGILIYYFRQFERQVSVPLHYARAHLSSNIALITILSLRSSLLADCRTSPTCSLGVYTAFG